jgi:hypothetical protein
MEKITKKGGVMMDKTQEIGNKIQRVGKTLTWMLTVPILLTVFFGTVGMVIGGVIFVLVVVGLFAPKKT